MHIIDRKNFYREYNMMGLLRIRTLAETKKEAIILYKYTGC